MNLVHRKQVTTFQISAMWRVPPQDNLWVIAWGNDDIDIRYVKHHEPRLLFINRTDIDDQQLIGLEKFIANSVSERYSYSLMNSPIGQFFRKSNFPWNPPRASDSSKIIDFLEKISNTSEPSLVVCCEYGRSRSVATAHFAAEMFNFSYSNEKRGNLRIRRFLDLEFNKRCINI